MLFSNSQSEANNTNTLILNNLSMKRHSNQITNEFTSHLKVDSASFVSHAPILIDGNADFQSQAATEGWDLSGARNGSATLPYLINGYNITGSYNLMIISNTNVYFEVSGNLINSTYSAYYCIELVNVENGVFTNNTIQI